MILRYIGLLGLYLFGAPAHAADLLDRIVAVAGEDIVMYSELRNEARTLFTQLKRADTTPMPTEQQILQNALESLILEKLQLTEAHRLGIQVDPKTLAQAMARIAKNNNLSLQELRMALVDEGINYEQFQSNVRKKIIIQRLINREVTNRIQVSKAEVDQQLKRQKAIPQGRRDVHLLQIVISIPEVSSPKQIGYARELANNARQQLDEGDNFRFVAQKFSHGRQAMRGGDLGWVSVNELPLAFIAHIKDAVDNQIIGPFRGNMGFYILKVLGFRGDGKQREIAQQTRARHILIRTDETTSDDEARNRLNQLRGRIFSGDDFATLARAYSADQTSAAKGGDLGWVSPGSLVPQFEEQMHNTDIGRTSRAFKTEFGWHIVQVLERRLQDISDEAQRAVASKVVRDRKAKEAEVQYLRRLRDEAYIEQRLNG